MSFTKLVSLLLVVLSLLYFSCPAFAISEEERSFLNMYFTEDELQVVSATRSLQSIARVAENITVITDDDIELMNAHTLGDVLKIVTGVQINPSGGPGTLFAPQIQGSEFYHIAAFMDGILFNTLGDNFPDITSIPTQIIEKIEIIKGPASSAWGSSLGGIINIITKTADSNRPIGGRLQASYSKHDTGDFSAELSGRKDKFGYYLFAGRLQSQGLTRNFDVSINNLYSKLAYNFTDDTSVVFNLAYNQGNRGDGDDLVSDVYYHNKHEILSAGLVFNTRITEVLKLNIGLNGLQRKVTYFVDQLSTGDELSKDSQKEKLFGASIKLDLKLKGHDIVLGSDYNNGKWRADSVTNGTQKQRKLAVFVNDTISIGELTIIPGLRYDDISTTNNFISPSLGLVYNVTKDTLLRAFVARGFNSPSLGMTSGESTITGNKASPDLKVEKVTSYQAGVETGALKYIWMKLSLFRHDIRDTLLQEPIDPIINFPFTDTMVNKGKQRRYGMEFEFRTKPVYHFTLAGGTTFMKSKDLETDRIVKDIPKYTFDVSLKYDDEKSFKALLSGHYIWWNTEKLANAKYSSFIFDLNIIKSFFKKQERSVDVFLTAHNLFDGSQYLRDYYKNPGRWVEAGVRFNF
jgi:vitamin B12 transporter